MEAWLEGPGYLAIATWLGGIVSWLLLAVLDFVAVSRRVRERMAYFEGAIAKDQSYAKEVGDIRQAAQNKVGSPSVSESLSGTFSHPFLLTMITGFGPFIVTSPKKVAWPMLGWLLATAYAIICVLLDAGALGKDGLYRRWYSVMFAWLIALGAFCLLSKCIP